MRYDQFYADFCQVRQEYMDKHNEPAETLIVTPALYSVLCRKKNLPPDTILDGEKMFFDGMELKICPDICDGIGYTVQ